MPVNTVAWCLCMVLILQHAGRQPCAGFPAQYKTAHVSCTTTKGAIDIMVIRRWSPIGADRFVDLVESGFFTNAPVFRAIEGFIVQFGISSDPQVTDHWESLGPLPDDHSLGMKFSSGMMAFAGSGENSRTTQVFIALNDNLNTLGQSPWETPFGIVLDMMPVMNMYMGYGDHPPGGNAPDQGRLMTEGGGFLKAEYPLMDYISSCTLQFDPSLMAPNPPLDVNMPNAVHPGMPQAPPGMAPNAQSPAAQRGFPWGKGVVLVDLPATASLLGAGIVGALLGFCAIRYCCRKKALLL